MITLTASHGSGASEKTPNRTAWPRIPRISVVRQPSVLSTTTRNAIVLISAICPMLKTSINTMAGLPTRRDPHDCSAEADQTELLFRVLEIGEGDRVADGNRRNVEETVDQHQDEEDGELRVDRHCRPTHLYKLRRQIINPEQPEDCQS